MKTPKLILASLFALTVANMASAQTTTTLRLTGSTAYRNAVHAAIIAIIQPSTLSYAYTGNPSTNPAGPSSSAAEAIFKGTTLTSIDGGIPVIIKTAWSGSVGGVFTLTTDAKLPDPAATPPITAGFLVDTTPTSSTGTSIPVASAVFDAATFADVAMSDSFQSSTKYYPPAFVPGTSCPYPVLTDTVVGVVPFVWVRNAGNAGSPGGNTKIANMTGLLAQAILSNPGIPLSFFTGVATDTALVYATGRNNDSGTRLDAFAETGFGIFTSPLQVDPTGTAGGNSIHADNISGGVWVTGSAPATIAFFTPAINGYSSGGSLATAMNATGSPTVLPGWLVTYLGIADAGTVNGGNNELTYNGVTYSDTNVGNGAYTFWAYEHFLVRGQTGCPPTNVPALAGNQLDVATAIASAVSDPTTGTAHFSGVSLGEMNVGRSVEGGVVTPGSPY